MSALTFFVKLLPYIWPFLKDMILGRKTFMEALRDNKKKALLIFIVIFSLGLNFFMVPRTTRMAIDYLALDKKYKELQTQCLAVPGTPKHTITMGSELKTPLPDPVPLTIPKIEMVNIKNPNKAIKHKPPVAIDHPAVDEVKNTYDAILKREQAASN